jgi:transcriptional regulator with XRE-family HTH domain
MAVDGRTPAFQELAAPFLGRLKEERESAGKGADELAAACGIAPEWYGHIEAGRVLPTLAEFERLRAALGDIPAERLYGMSLLNAIGALGRGQVDFAKFYGDLQQTAHLLASRDEVRWMERDVAPDRSVDVFVNMSCGTQDVPHLLMNTYSVLEALGISFVAAAGRVTCCGTYYRNAGNPEGGYRMHDASVARRLKWGARTTVHWCTSCEQTFTDGTRRAELREPNAPRMRDVQLLTYLDEVLREREGRIPWKAPVAARVLIGRVDIGPTIRIASDRAAELLARIPGAEVVGFLDLGDPQRQSMPKTPEDVRARREELAEQVRSRGANTISFSHFSTQRILNHFASDAVAIRNPISILAEALGCEHPDRHQAAIRLGDVDAVVDQLRPIWSSWDMSEDDARRIATRLVDPVYAEGPTQHACGGGGRCGEQLIDVDVLAGTVRRH